MCVSGRRGPWGRESRGGVVVRVANHCSARKGSLPTNVWWWYLVYATDRVPKHIGTASNSSLRTGAQQYRPRPSTDDAQIKVASRAHVLTAIIKYIFPKGSAPGDLTLERAVC